MGERERKRENAKEEQELELEGERESATMREDRKSQTEKGMERKQANVCVMSAW